MIDEKYRYSALTEKIIGCAMTIHKELGNGFQKKSIKEHYLLN